MRRHGRVDANQTAIVKALRQTGATVQSLADIGKGCPDLLVGYRGTTYLLEVKDGSKPPSARLLTPDEGAWMAAWRGGPLHIVASVDEALDTVAGVRR
jgi:hypothetical protein